jgi:catechol 2,3-dioxygenase-like lactoylglutathione lyase family enzyme
MRVASIALIAVAACGGQRAHSTHPADCNESAPLGSRDRMTTPVAAATGPAIDPPVACRDLTGFGSGAYVRVHGRGDQRFSTDNDAEAFGERVLARLKTRGITLAEVDLGVCHSDHGVGEDAQMSVAVHDWKDADAAIAAVAAELEQAGIGETYAVAIRGWSCPTATAERSR